MAASDVSICNAALAALGDAAAVTAISPTPDPSRQAALCAQFYPIARDALLEMAWWTFATFRVALANVSMPAIITTWQYAYLVPNGVLRYIEILDPETTDEYSIGLQVYNGLPGVVQWNIGMYQPQNFEIEEVDGQQYLLTNQENAVLRYTARVVDPAQFTPLFVVALSKLLASFLAGPLIKGQEGRQASQAKEQEFMTWFAQATGSDASQRNVQPTPSPRFIAQR